MFAASKSGSFEASDAQFNYVTMLLHGDGTNGAQNNTFVDSSTNAFSITRNGNPTQGTFTPYGSNWSNYFGTSGQYLQVSDSTPLNLSGGSYTIECWVNPTGNYAGYNTLIAKRVTGGGATSWEVTLSVTTGYLTFYNGTLYASTTTPVANTWSHIAAVYDGTNINLYVNGTRALQTAVTNSNTSASVTIANFDNAEPFFGYMSNVRVTKGAALYTGTSFTVPTSPLTTTVSAGTVSLLTCQSNRFIDTSVNAATVTVTGSPSVQRFSPFSITSSYSTGGIGGSGYFDGSDSLSISSANTVLPTGTQDFSVELSVYWQTQSGSYPQIISNPTTSGFQIYYDVSAGALAVGIFNIANVITYTIAQSDLAGSWTHIAVTRSGTTFRLFVNGVLRANGTNVISFASPTTQYIASDGSRPYTGYITDVRTCLGSIPTSYQTSSTTNGTSIFTSPTAPVTTSSQGAANTALLLSYTNAGILDNAMMNDLETVGNAQISTSVKKYGTGSISLDGTGDYLAVPSTPNLGFGSGNFTVEAWLYLTSAPTGANAMYVCDFRNGSTNNFGFGVIASSGNTKPYMFVGSGPVDATGATSLSLNTWYHIAMVRSGSTVTYYLNGVSDATMTTSFSQGTTGVTVGARYTGSTEYVAGYIDDLRITKGLARYTATFTPPIVAFADKG